MNCLFKLRARIVRPSLLCLVLNYCSNISAAHCAFRQGKIPQVATKVLELAGAPSASWQRQLAPRVVYTVSIIDLSTILYIT